MRFRKKLILSYFAFMLLVSTVLGFAYHAYSRAEQEKAEEQNMELLAWHMLKNTDVTLASMENIMSYFVSDPEIISALKTLSGEKPDGLLSSRRREACTAIQSKLTTDYIIRHFYRVIYFNDSGDCISGNNFDATILNPSSAAERYPWLDRVAGTKGTPVFLAPHADYWGLKENPTVISLVKELQGNHMGYLEVELLCEDLESFYQTDQIESNVVAFYDSDILYTDLNMDSDSALLSFYREQRDVTASGSVTVKNPANGRREHLFWYDFAGTPMSLFIIRPVEAFGWQSVSTLLLSLLLAGCFLLVSVLFVVTISHHVTRPLLQFKQLIDHTEIENLRTLPGIRTRDDEISEVARAYQALLVRLDRSITREKQLSLLQLKSRFDLLQTQINPHFLYNVLNLLISRGVENEDDMTCEICGSLASMLRYSLNTRERYAPLSEELAYLEQYFYLLKCRYRRKLEYEIDIEESISCERIPRIILQQFVENSIRHGYEQSSCVMHITVTGWKSGDNWMIRIRDNGSGFPADVLSGLSETFSRIRGQLGDSPAPMETGIGGMGLANAYARLYLIYGDQLIFELKNADPGAEVLLGAPADMKRNFAGI